MNCDYNTFSIILILVLCCFMYCIYKINNLEKQKIENFAVLQRKVFAHDIAAVKGLSTFADQLKNGGISMSGIVTSTNAVGGANTSKGFALGGACEGIFGGNGDGATKDTHNVVIKSWNGLGFKDSSYGYNATTGCNGTGATNIWFDLRNGIMNSTSLNTGPTTITNTSTAPVLTLANYAYINAPDGRMHLGGANDLYVLNKEGMTCSKAWGGNGNISAEGALSGASISTGGALSAGSITTGGTLSAGCTSINNTGNGHALTFTGTTIISSPNRIHLAGTDDVHVLNTNGFKCGKAWGGNGNITAEGNLTVSGAISLGPISTGPTIENKRNNFIRIGNWYIYDRGDCLAFGTNSNGDGDVKYAMWPNGTGLWSSTGTHPVYKYDSAYNKTSIDLGDVSIWSDNTKFGMYYSDRRWFAQQKSDGTLICSDSTYAQRRVAQQ